MWGVHLSVSFLFAFSYCSWASLGKNAEVVCHSLLQWTMFCQNSPPWPVCVGCVQFSSVTQLCLTLCDPMDFSPPARLSPWNSPGKNTGVGCHFLLNAWKWKSESEVVRLCPTLSDPMDCSLPGSSVLGIFQALVETKSKTRAHLFQDCNDF